MPFVILGSHVMLAESVNILGVALHVITIDALNGTHVDCRLDRNLDYTVHLLPHYFPGPKAS